MGKEKRYEVQCGATILNLTMKEIKQTIINCGEILLEKEEEVNETNNENVILTEDLQ